MTKHKISKNTNIIFSQDISHKKFKISEKWLGIAQKSGVSSEKRHCVFVNVTIAIWSNDIQILPFKCPSVKASNVVRFFYLAAGIT